MKTKAFTKKLRREQLDQHLRLLAPLRDIPIPTGGWAKSISEALGISTRQLASKMGVNQSNLVHLEKNEVDGKISLNTLKKLGEAIGCKLVYALIPEKTLEQMVQQRAHRVAQKIVEQVSHSMELEKQGTSKKSRENQIRELAEQLVREMSPNLWGSE